MNQNNNKFAENLNRAIKAGLVPAISSINPNQAQVNLAGSGNWPKRSTITPEQAEVDATVWEAFAGRPWAELEEYCGG